MTYSVLILSPHDRFILLKYRIVTNSEQRDYPKTVYDNAWEDLDVLYESWKTVHGVDRQFCIEMIRKFANHLANDNP
mgnify:CR=1 FL=1